MRILIAEDNPINEAIARRMLDRLGHTYAIAHNGVETLEALRRGEVFDCILMDIQMPRMDGIEATWRIHEEFPPGPQRPPIIAATANPRERDEPLCRAAGMVDFLAKPLRLAALSTALDSLGAARADEMPTTSEESNEIDLEHFASIMDGGDAEAIEIFNDFTSDVPEQIASMEAFARAEAAGEFAALAHQLKGSSATFGLVAFSSRMGDLETLGASGQLGDLAEEWAQGALEAFRDAERVLRQQYL